MPIPSQCFPPSARLLRPAEFAHLRKLGQRLPLRYFHSEITPNLYGQARLGLAVSRRVSKKAVQRNRIKRLVRESFRHIRSQLPAFDILVIPRIGAAEQDNAILREDIARLWERIQTITPKA